MDTDIIDISTINLNESSSSSSSSSFSNALNNNI